MECVDIITTDNIGITVWSYTLPPEDDMEPNDGPIPFLNIVHPHEILDLEHGIQIAKAQLGDFSIKSAS